MFGLFLGGDCLCKFYQDFFRFEFLDEEHVHIVSEKLAAETDIYGGLYLVPRQYPYLNSGYLKVPDCRTYIVLQHIFDSCAP